MRRLGLVTLVVPEYDEAIAYYTEVLGFHLREDTLLAPDGKRWVVLAPSPGAETCLLLARAVGERQRARVGDQTGGRVGFFLATDDFDADLARLTGAGVTLEEPPRTESYGRVVVFVDRYGNRWDLIQPTQGSASPPA
ncbi:VOC family protein [Streptomyces sp. DSM 44915]|uniref:VOC family protein n=1 Tax=Streptomyces chisholmiae TaxID=3075540 RepID=A0ABU2JQ06_9ACTN|nr:VOC family protein [Streptomyces sp. DSM 44915]MDT0267077.1 VOC family protein [Streptomyces sp. DSM 44915]